MCGICEDFVSYTHLQCMGHGVVLSPHSSCWDRAFLRPVKGHTGDTTLYFIQAWDKHRETQISIDT